MTQNGESCGKIESVTILSTNTDNGYKTAVLRVVTDKNYADCGSLLVALLDGEDNVVVPYYDAGPLDGVITDISVDLCDSRCKIALKLANCCGGPAPSENPVVTCPDLPDRDCGCTPLTDCPEEPILINDPYILPIDFDKPTPYNPVLIPNKFTVVVTQNDCEADATITAIPCRLPEFNFCDVLLFPNIDIYTLPGIDSGCEPYGRPIDIDIQCSPTLRCPTYPLKQNFELYYRITTQLIYPSIDGVIYDIGAVSVGTVIKIHTSSTDSEMRLWVCQHFRFFTRINNAFTANWPFNDLYWIPQLDHPQADPDTVYINLIPC